MNTSFSVSFESDIPIVFITESAHFSLVSTLGILPAEKGGLLFGYEDDYVIRRFLFDKHAYTSSSTYSFNTEYLNPFVFEYWEKERLSVLGFVHSHPQGCSSPSNPDVEYFAKMFKVMPRKFYVVPIIESYADGEFSFNCFLFFPDGSLIKATKIIVPDDFIISKKYKKTNRFFPNKKTKAISKFSDTTIFHL